MMPTIEGEVTHEGERGVYVRAVQIRGFVEKMKSVSVWLQEKEIWFVTEACARDAEQLLLDYWPEFMHVGGKKDGFIVNRLGLVSVQERLL